MNAAEFHAAAGQVAVALGGGWAAVARDERGSTEMMLCTTLRGPDAVVLELAFGRIVGRWDVRGLLEPELRRHSRYEPLTRTLPPESILVAGHKTPGQVAAEIRGRYLGAWSAWVAHRRTVAARCETSRALVLAIGAQLLGVLGRRARWLDPGASHNARGAGTAARAADRELYPDRNQLAVDIGRGRITGLMTINEPRNDRERATITVNLTMPADLGEPLAELLLTVRRR